ncbi:MAG TPA: peptidylprolyl isomerase [Ensifer sp.]|jgi:hypothetical protein|uniref:peptidylprolyl isomerase n=1 Tax=Ensifer sp. TaxID=1872086 RepID=UPI002E144F5D|nr:peptidylprolyl isomerase [Ensifer sp.]
MLRLLREPLLQFMLLGAVLFALATLVTGAPEDAPSKIVVTAAQIDNMALTFAKVWQRNPSPDELRGLIEDYVRDEVYYREGKALGIDTDDIVIRRRIRQKMEFFAEDAAAIEPTDDDLRSYLAAHPQNFRTEPKATFRQVFLSASREGSLDVDATNVGLKLAKPDIDPETLGDGFLLGTEFDGRDRSEVATDFGERFAEKIFSVPLGGWQGPFVSPYGLHFVFVLERAEAATRPLGEVRDAVAREWANARRIEKLEQFYQTLRTRYEVVVDPPAGAPAIATAEKPGATR